MNLSAEAEFETHLSLSCSLSLISLLSLNLFILFSLPDSLSATLFKDLSHISLFLSPFLLTHLSKTAATVLVPFSKTFKKGPEFKFHLCKKDIVTNPQGN